MRADALENRTRLLQAATSMFREHGIEVTVGEIADAAGVGRGTVFRNFPTKDHLIVAVLAERMREVAASARELLRSDQDDAEIAFTLAQDLAGSHLDNRALLQSFSEEWVSFPELQAVHDELIEVIDQILDRAKLAGAVRPEVTVMDLLVLLKGLCLIHVSGDEAAEEAVLRYLELVRAAISTPAFARPLRGRPPTLTGH